MSWSDTLPLLLQARYRNLLVGDLWLTLLLCLIALLIIYPLWRRYLLRRGRAPGRVLYLIILGATIVGGKALLEIGRNAMVVKQQIIVEEHASRLRGSSLAGIDYLEKSCGYQVDADKLHFPVLPLNESWVAKARQEALAELNRSPLSRDELCHGLVKLLQPYDSEALRQR
ncbi:MAG: hypothetical protein KAY06_01230 [Aeromonadaceae bacterium]|nr:hypothetical protein [Aeromonadaceae bacterium]